MKIFFTFTFTDNKKDKIKPYFFYLKVTLKSQVTISINLFWHGTGTSGFIILQINGGKITATIIRLNIHTHTHIYIYIYNFYSYIYILYIYIYIYIYI